MVKPAKRGPIRRRIITVSVYATAFALLSVTSPLWLPAAWLVGLFRRRSFILLRLLVFAWFYFGFELIALLLVALIFVKQRDEEAREPLLYELQAWWASVNLGLAGRLLRLRFEVEGEEQARRGPSILLARHASILDTLLPCTYLQRPYGLRVRYILKQELLFDPCIDIVGNAVPNYFVDRTGNTPEELEAIRSLVDGLDDDAVLLFPEGTRFSPKKRERALSKLRDQGSAFYGPAEAMRAVLPPKPGGVLTLLDALPEVDCVFLAHSGLESFARVKDLLSGEVVGSRVRVRFWRVEARDVPKSADEQLGWLFAQWGKVDAFVRNELETS